MNKAKTAMLLTTVLLFCSTFIVLANASDCYTYNLTNASGNAAQPNQPFTVTASTNNLNVVKVNITWINPAGQTVFNETVKITMVGENKIAASTFTPNALGDWTVLAEFKDVRNYIAFSYRNEIKTRTTFNVVPEVPLLGTAGIAIAMAVGLVFYKKRSPN